VLGVSDVLGAVEDKDASKASRNSSLVCVTASSVSGFDGDRLA
jgi:hypothetical protein